jgi:hypothetical protein
MGYTLEISFDIRKNPLSFKSELKILAVKHECESEYFINEIEGRGKTIDRNSCVHIVTFDNDKSGNILPFLRELKKYPIYVECIYRDDNYTFIHVSSYYLSKMDKEIAKSYKKGKKKREINELETGMLEILRMRNP